MTEWEHLPKAISQQGFDYGLFTKMLKHLLQDFNKDAVDFNKDAVDAVESLHKNGRQNSKSNTTHQIKM